MNINNNTAASQFLNLLYGQGTNTNSNITSSDIQRLLSHSNSDLKNSINQIETDMKSGLSNFDKQMALLNRQEQMQMNNQIISSLSNMLQVMHQTAMSIIRNFRV